MTPKNSSYYLQQLCYILNLKAGSPEKSDHLAKAAQWALADDRFPLTHYQPRALTPILSTLKGNDSPAFVPAVSLTLKEKVMMPRKTTPTAEDLKKQYLNLKNALSNANTEMEMLCALEIHGSTLAINEKFNDLSLFDFCKITAGIASCLERSNKVRLIGGSISGIQNYLYDLVSKNASKLLKGRSFYLQLLIDSLLLELLKVKEFGLSHANIIYSSGGGFFVIAPDLVNIEILFQQFSEKITKEIYQTHKHSIFAELSITRAFDSSVAIDEIWKALYEDLESLRFHRFYNNQGLLDDFFKDSVEEGGLRGRDHITNDEFEEGESPKTLPDGSQVSTLSQQQIELGRKLSVATHWITSENNLGSGQTIKDPFGNSHGLIKKTEGKSMEATSVSRALNQINNHDAFYFYGGNQFPTFSKEEIDKMKDPEEKDQFQPGYIKPFEYFLDKNSHLKRLGILRMDVDDLGAIFSHEIKIATYSVNLVRYAATSRNLDYFFKGYINTLQHPFKDSSIVVYSGGDDLFIIGRWDNVLQLAQSIQESFADWTCNNLSLSGGIVLLPAKFPIMQGARLAGDAEKKAKKHKLRNGKQKNAICLFDVPLHWQKEFSIVKGLYDELLPFFRSKEFSKSLLSKINGHAMSEQSYRLALENNVPASPKWKWVMAYDLSRYSKNLESKAKGLIDRISQNAFMNMHDGRQLEGTASFLTLLQVAGRWVELQLRHEKSDEFND